MGSGALVSCRQDLLVRDGTSWKPRSSRAGAPCRAGIVSREVIVRWLDRRELLGDLEQEAVFTSKEVVPGLPLGSPASGWPRVEWVGGHPRLGRAGGVYIAFGPRGLDDIEIGQRPEFGKLVFACSNG
jgi:hypothetical protein